jgi:hypothetical protein
MKSALLPFQLQGLFWMTQRESDARVLKGGEKEEL